ncbi:hypothetical protein [Tepidiforma thermophila]|uniref:Uncharacterized protein n=1 Tax=Tepidiforma thermophila (strain KCTC 52669 / CGMCC 1.13589 / G233) TaxID=2761530 RepID=A0A2A9HES9_TEPT2|nr:hypothetical protein [Tepidiforma thermophila]PFG73515.1 hypothetical protein A9A59_0713 [Tepidiforma thermophila]
MKRAILLAIASVAAATASIPALVMAQGAPPSPPATFYGSVPSGVGPGQTVLAIVTSGGSSQTCGVGQTIADGSGVVYVVDVIADSQLAGCGAPGRTVQFYFVGNRQLATDTATWSGAGPSQRNLTGLGPQLTPRNYGPMVAKDGTN